MISCLQSSNANAYVLGARVDRSTYKSMVPLMSAGGYENVSTFVRDALLTKCKDIANELTDGIQDSVEANNTRLHKT